MRPRAFVERVVHRIQTPRRPAAGGLPPGDLDPLDELEKSDRCVFEQRFERFGPVTMGSIRDEPTVCIVGLARCRQFLKEHADSLEISTLDLTAMFSGGFMRGMHGETHLDYRRALIRAIRTAGSELSSEEVEEIAAREIALFVADQTSGERQPEAWKAALSKIATSTLVRSFFGAPHGSALHGVLVDGFAELGPFGLVWNPKARQHAALEALCVALRSELTLLDEGRSEMSPTCLLGVLHASDQLDDTMLGNLVYMVEMGRADILNLYRWLSRYASLDSAMCAAIACGDQGASTRSIEEAFVLEVLRTDQSERLERRTTTKIDFDGYRIPAGTPVRLCMWESHHDATTFPEPHEFDHRRFVDDTQPADVFSPFGLDHHQCPFGSLTSLIGTAFVRALCAYEITGSDDGLPIRGAYHWEPSRRLALTLEPR